MLSNNLGLVRKLAWSFHNSTSIDPEELYMQGCVIGLQAERRYDPERGIAFSTFIYTAIRNELIDYINRERKWYDHNLPLMVLSIEEDEMSTVEDVWAYNQYQAYHLETSPERKTLLRQHLSALSKVGKVICDMALDGVRDRKHMTDRLRSDGYTWSAIEGAFKEVKLMLQEVAT